MAQLARESNETASRLNFDPEMTTYIRLKKDKVLRYRFDLDRAYPYYNMLSKQRRGKVDSWAIRWYLSVFMRDGLTLYPSQTLIQNIGFDGSGTHSALSRRHEDLSMMQTGSRILVFPEKAEVLEQQSFDEIKNSLRKNGSLIYILKSAFRGLVERYY